MTDNKIIEALDCCRIENCNECPHREYYNCREVLVQDVFSIINRQKEEIERLQNRCEDCAGCTQWKCDCSNIRTEAIKEFAEKLKGELTTGAAVMRVSVLNIINNLVEEMVGLRWDDDTTINL